MDPTSPHPSATSATETSVGLFAALAIAASLARLSGSTAGAYLAARTSGDVSTALRGRVLAALFALHRLRRPRQLDHGRPCTPASEVGDHARAVSALTFRIREVATALESALSAGRAALQLVLLAIVGCVVAPRLFLLALLVLAPFAVLLNRVRGRLRSIQREEMRAADALLEAADEAVRHGDVWRVFGARGKIAAHLSRLGREARDRGARLAAMASAQSGANELLGIVAVALALWGLARFAPGDASSLGPFAVPFFLAYRPLRDFAEAKIALSRAREAARDLDEVLADASVASALEADASASASAPREWTLARVDIEALVHPWAQWSPLSVSVEPGSIVAIVGPTGSGKSTLLRILLGLEPQASGLVSYGGALLEPHRVGPESRPFAWVPQDAPVLAASLADNVMLCAPESPAADPADLLASIGASGLLAVADQRLGTGHRALSGGERQWLSIARALATPLPVLLLDEPTAGLDPQSERAVLSALAALRGTRTIVIVTHREGPTKIADRVIRLGADASLDSWRSLSFGGVRREKTPPRAE